MTDVLQTQTGHEYDSSAEMAHVETAGTSLTLYNLEPPRQQRPDRALLGLGAVTSVVYFAGPVGAIGQPALTLRDFGGGGVWEYHDDRIGALRATGWFEDYLDPSTITVSEVTLPDLSAISWLANVAGDLQVIDLPKPVEDD